jgi:hypothetical protein
LERIQKRDLYKCAGEAILSQELDLECKEIKPEDIIGYSEKLKVDDLVVCDYKLNYGCKNKNPVDFVVFYNEYTASSSFKIGKRQTSLVLPEVFQERNVKIFAKSDEKVSFSLSKFHSLMK